MSGIVNLDEIPPIPLSGADVGEAANRLRTRAQDLAEAGSEHKQVWKELPEVYETEHTTQLVERSRAVEDVTARAEYSTSSAADALERLATELTSLASEASELAAEMVMLRRQIVDHRLSADSTSENPYWGPGQYSANERLRSRARKLDESIEGALADCKRALESVPAAPRGLRSFAPAPGTVAFQSDVSGSHIEFENYLSLGILNALGSQPNSWSTQQLWDAHPEWAEYFWEHPPDAGVVAKWWEDLTPAEKYRLVAGASLVVGNLNGVPLGSRITANRNTLSNEIDRLRDLPEDDRDQELLDQYEHLLNTEVRQRNEAGTWGFTEGSQLLVFDPMHDAIATYHGVIDPATGQIPHWVENVAISVPGTGSDLLGFADERAAALYKASHERSTSSHTVVIQWRGSNMPAHFGATSAGDSQEAAPRLARLANSLALPPSSNVTVLGHSYGGAVIGSASAQGLEADRVLFVSAAGMGSDVTGITDYPAHLTTDYYSMMVPNDAVVGHVQFSGTNPLAPHGQTPLDTPGVTRLETGRIDASDPGSVSLEDYKAPGNGKPAWLQSHSSLYTEGSTAFDSMVTVITGGEAQVFMPDETSKAEYVLVD